MRNNKGITLIALVITIIVLLILAGVSIAMLSGDNSILGNATKSADYNYIGEVKDLLGLKVNEYVMAFLDHQYNNSDYTGEQAEILTSSVTTTEQAVVATINSFKEGGKNAPSNGTTVKYASGTITIESVNYKTTGTVDESKGSIKWNPVVKK